jgi:hypothetical protein
MPNEEGFRRCVVLRRIHSTGCGEGMTLRSLLAKATETERGEGTRRLCCDLITKACATWFFATSGGILTAMTIVNPLKSEQFRILSFQ